MANANIVEMKSSTEPSPRALRTATNQRKKALRDARSARALTVPWKRAVRKLKTDRQLPWNELYRRLKWTRGFMWWRCKQPDLRSSLVALMADAMKVKRGRLFEALAEELEAEGLMAKQPRADR